MASLHQHASSSANSFLPDSQFLKNRYSEDNKEKKDGQGSSGAVRRSASKERAGDIVVEDDAEGMLLFNLVIFCL